MSALAIVMLFLFAFGATASAGLLFLGLREYRAGGERWFGPAGASALVLCTVWFVINLVIAALALHVVPTDAAAAPLEAVVEALSFFFAPLMMHAYSYERSSLGADPRWRLPLAAAYVSAAALAAARWQGPTRASGMTIDLVDVGWFLLLLAAVVVSVAGFLSVRREGETRSERSYRDWNLVFLTLLALCALPWLLASTGPDSTAALAPRAVPLLLVATAAYFQRRFAFFDFVVKWGAFLTVSVAFLAGALMLSVVVAPGVSLDAVPPVIVLLLVLPLLFAAPWIQRRLDRWLDARLLGRTIGPVDAVRSFLEGTLPATTEAELVAAAEWRLSALFRAPAKIALGISRLHGAQAFPAAYEVCLRHGEREIGVLRLGPRRNEAPYFAEDRSLAISLGNVFSALWSSLIAQEQKRQEERRGQRLQLEAARSDLRALRAQVNPHFLFNALNTVASLIAEHPARAEETLERLADVFRYTLSRAEREWVSVNEEVDFVRAYLAIEQARTDDRLDVQVHLDPAASGALIPAMTLRVLAENAVKHGVGHVRGGGRVVVRVARGQGRLVVSVSDDGPGFSLPDVLKSPPEGEAPHGLQNLVRRLRGYFGDAVSIRAERRGPDGSSVVRLEMPVRDESATRATS